MNKLLMIVFSAILLSGCSVTEQRIKEAQVLCENNGGIKWVAYNGETKCKNGARFSK